MRRTVLALLLCVAPAAFGQGNYAVVTGTLTDPQKSPVAGSSVLLTAKETRAERRVTSNTVLAGCLRARTVRELAAAFDPSRVDTNELRSCTGRGAGVLDLA